MRFIRTIINLGLLVTACTPIQSILIPADPGLTEIAWQEIAPGLELVQFNGANALSSRITTLRVDPEHYQFRVHYRPGDPTTSEGWQMELASVAAFINANFYDSAGKAIGWLVEDGNSWVQPHPRYGGALIVSDETVRVITRAAQEQPVDQAVQGFPTLVRSGDAANRLNGVALARRSVMAEDQQGRILFFHVGGIGMTLAGFANWLVEQPLGIVNAVNLDGGGSSMLIVKADENVHHHSRDPVPAVLAIHPRNP